MSRSMLPILALLTCSAVVRAAPVAQKVTVAVLDLRAEEKDAAMAAALVDVVSEEVARVPNTRALSRKDIQALLSEEMRKQMTGCTDSSCLAELGDALNAEALVTGELARVGASMLVTLQLINHRYASVMNRVSLSWPGALKDLPDVARVATQMLMLTREQKQQASLKVVDAPGGATVYVNETAIRGTRISPIDLGVHLVRITASGHDERSFPVIIGNGATVKVNGALDAIPLYRRPFFWVGTAGAVAGASILTAAVVGIIPLTILLFATGDARVQARQSAPPVQGF